MKIAASSIEGLLDILASAELWVAEGEGDALSGLISLRWILLYVQFSVSRGELEMKLQKQMDVAERDAWAGLASGDDVFSR